MIRASIYARVSHAGDQNPEQQLDALRAYVAARGWQLADEITDRASAADLLNRTGWRRLLGRCRRREIDTVVVWKLDRAFRSPLAALSTLERLQAWGIDFVCVTQPIDTGSSMGRFVFTMLAAVAEMERSLISERTRAGLERARKEGVKLGRPLGRTDTRKRRPRRSRLAMAQQLEDAV